MLNRRDFLRKSMMFTVGLTSFSGVYFWWENAESSDYFLPPAALPKEEFLKKCIRCFKCAEACPFGTLKLFDMNNIKLSQTPYIPNMREVPCFLCMKCTTICPTEALKPTKTKKEDIIANVKIGVAIIDCHHPRCTRCYQACPLRDDAIILNENRRPEVIADKCPGCGVCEYVCPFTPPLIKVVKQGDQV